MDKLKQVVAGVALAAGVASAQDFSKMQKPELVDKIVAKSLSVKCEPLIGAQAKEASYEARLRFAVASADTTDLMKLAKDNVAICLNRNIDPSFWERSVHGAFFNMANASKVLMIADTPTGRPELTGAQTREVITRFNNFDIANTAAPNSTTYGVMGGRSTVCPVGVIVTIFSGYRNPVRATKSKKKA